MTRKLFSPGVLAVLFVVAVVGVAPGGLSAADGQTISASSKLPSIRQLNDPKLLIELMDQRVTAVEVKLAAAEKKLAAAQAHSHSYQAPQCSEFVSLSNLSDAIGNPGDHAGMGVCLIRRTAAGSPLSQTSQPSR